MSLRAPSAQHVHESHGQAKPYEPPKTTWYNPCVGVCFAACPGFHIWRVWMLVQQQLVEAVPTLLQLLELFPCSPMPQGSVAKEVPVQGKRLQPRPHVPVGQDRDFWLARHWLGALLPQPPLGGGSVRFVGCPLLQAASSTRVSRIVVSVCAFAPTQLFRGTPCGSLLHLQLLLRNRPRVQPQYLWWSRPGLPIPGPLCADPADDVRVPCPRHCARAHVPAPFFPHAVPSVVWLGRIGIAFDRHDFCESAARWLAADPANVVGVHCKVGRWGWQWWRWWRCSFTRHGLLSVWR